MDQKEFFKNLRKLDHHWYKLFAQQPILTANALEQNILILRRLSKDIPKFVPRFEEMLKILPTENGGEALCQLVDDFNGIKYTLREVYNILIERSNWEYEDDQMEQWRAQLVDHYLILCKERNRFAKENIGLVLKFVKPFEKGLRTSSRNDLVQVGYEGLLKAIEKFDDSYDARFSTYAAFSIKQAFGRYLDNFEREIRVPVSILDRLRKAFKTGKEPEEFFRESGFEMESYKTLFNKSLWCLDAPVPNQIDGGKSSFVDLTAEPEEHILDREKKKQIETLILHIGKLSPLRREIIGFRFGLFSEYKTLRQLMKHFKMDHKNLQFIEQEILEELRFHFSQDIQS